MIEYSNLPKTGILRMLNRPTLNIKCPKAASCPHGEGCTLEPSQCTIFNEISGLDYNNNGLENLKLSEINLEGLDDLLRGDYSSRAEDYKSSRTSYTNGNLDSIVLAERNLPYNTQDVYLQESSHHSSADYLSRITSYSPVADYNATENYNGENN